MLTYDTPATSQGRIQDFKLGGAHLKKSRRAEGDAKNLGYFVWKITILRQKIIFFSNFRGGARRVRPPLDPPLLPMIWGTYMKLVTKYQISAINSCWEKCAYMFNVDKNQLSRQTGSRNLMVPKTLPTIWHTYVKPVTKYQISAINSCWEKCDEKYFGKTDGQR